MEIAAFADEINRDDPAHALELAARWGVAAVEVRALPGGRFPRGGDDELDELGRRAADLGLAISGVSPGLFKSPVDDGDVPRDIAGLLPRACDWARRWGTERVSVFGFGRGDEPHSSGRIPAAVVDAMGRMAAVAAGAGCHLVLENEAVCWGDTGTEAAALVRAVDSPHLSLCWDPGNAARAGVAHPVANEYAGLADLVTHVHLKNFDPGVDGWSRLDTGVVDWPAQLATLADGGYAGWLVLETHLQTLPAGAAALTDAGQTLSPLESNTLHNLRVLRRLLADVPGGQA